VYRDKGESIVKSFYGDARCSILLPFLLYYRYTL
jgi:hypothetical protein